MAIEENKVLTLEEVKKQGLRYDNYMDGVCSYKAKDGRVRLMIDGKDVLEGLKAVWCEYYVNGIYKYQTEDGKWHEGQVELINQ